MILSIVVPAYNEANTLAEVVDRVMAVELPPGVTKELVLVDDGSTDGTGEIMSNCVGQYGCKACTLPTNLGKGAAVRTGFAQATGEFVVVQDADLELDPQAYPGLLRPLLEGHADAVYGSRFLGSKSACPFLCWLANRVLTCITNLLYGSRLTDMETAYKAIRREALDRIRLRCSGFELEPEITAILLRLGYRIVEVPVGYRPRTKEEGKKIRVSDAVTSAMTLMRYRLAPTRHLIADRASART